jgi:hypothetical protein
MNFDISCLVSVFTFSEQNYYVKSFERYMYCDKIILDYHLLIMHQLSILA